MPLTPNDLKYIWTNFFGSFIRKKKIDYSLFKPTWLDSQTVFVVGRGKTKLFPFELDRMMKHHNIRSNDSRTTAKCILVTWMDRERNTAPVLIRRLAENGLTVQLAENRVEPESCNSLSASEMSTLLPHRFSTHSVIDAFMCILSDNSTKILPARFAFHLYRSSADDISTWPIFEDGAENASNISIILVPLHNFEENHWALAVLRKNDQYL